MMLLRNSKKSRLMKRIGPSAGLVVAGLLLLPALAGASGADQLARHGAWDLCCSPHLNRAHLF